MLRAAEGMGIRHRTGQDRRDLPGLRSWQWPFVKVAPWGKASLAIVHTLWILLCMLRSC